MLENDNSEMLTFLGINYSDWSVFCRWINGLKSENKYLVSATVGDKHKIIVNTYQITNHCKMWILSSKYPKLKIS